MCLYVDDNAKAETTEENIVVYKIIKKNKKLLRNKYTTPFQNTQVKWKKRLIENSVRVLFVEHLITLSTVNIGFHSFENIEDAKNIMKNDSYFKGADYVIAECVIPKSAQYIKGKWSDKPVTSYVSNQIKYLKVVK